MRRVAVIMALSALLVMLGGMVTASPALAGRGPKWEFLPAEPFTLPASICGFKIRVSFPVNKEYGKILKTTNGSTGRVTLSNTNLSTGKTITTNLSGPSKRTTFPDGSIAESAKGHTA